MFSFKSIPLLKIILPYLVGIFYVLTFAVFSLINFYFILSIGLVLLTFTINKCSKSKNKFKKIAFIVSINIFLFLLAHQSFYFYNAKNNTSHFSHFVTSNEQKSIVSLLEVPVYGEKSLKLTVNVEQIYYNNTWKYVSGKTIIYLKKDSLINYTVGDYLTLNTKWSYINPPKNPNEFNYKYYLENKNIFNLVYANSKQLVKLNQYNNSFSLSMFGEKIKSTIVSSLRNSNLSENAFSICSALLVGFDDEINKEILTSFSHSGTLHILSVSGMHTGVICAIILFIFSLIDKEDRFKKTKCVVIISVLIFFTTITGFSPSVLRASLMLSLIIIGKTIQKQSNSYNTLLLSAFILLLINPLLIIDVGFLLSYFAVFGIMYLYPILDSLYFIENKILKWFWSSCLISISATIFTLPITLFFFHQFPIWFVLSNLIIIPISLIIMLFTFLIVVLNKILFLKSFFVIITNTLVYLMIEVSSLTDNTKFGYIDSIAFNKLDVIFLSILIIVFFIFFTTKYYKYGVMLLSVSILWLTACLFKSYNELKNNEIIVFHVKQKSFLMTRIGKTFYCDINAISLPEFNRYVKPYLLNYNNIKINNTTANKICINNIQLLNLTNKNKLEYNDSLKYILITNNAKINLGNIEASKPLVIADCSNSYKTIMQLKKECATHHLQFYNVKENGALIIKTK